MATLDDMATEREEQFRDMALKAQAERSKHGQLTANGTCHFCGEEDDIDFGALFCCTECQRDWESRDRAKQIAGVM